MNPSFQFSIDDRPERGRHGTLLSAGNANSSVPAAWGQWYAGAVAGRDLNWQLRHLTIPQLVLARACERPGDAAYRQKRMGIHDEWTWLRVMRHAARAADFFQRHNVGSGQRVIFIGDPGVDAIVLQIAALACGAIVANLYPSHSASDLAQLIALAEPAMIVVDRQDQIDKIIGASPDHAAIPILSFDGRVRSLHQDQHVFFYADIAGQEAAVEPQDFVDCLVRATPDQAAFLIFTQFSTGAPAGMTQTHAGYLHVLNNLVALDPVLRQQPRSVVAMMPMAHVLGQAAAYLPILSRAIAHFPEDGSDGVALLRDVSPDVVLLAPVYYRKLSSMLLSELRATGGLKKAAYKLAMHAAARQDVGKWLRAAARLLVFRPLLAKFGLGRIRFCATGGAVLPQAEAELWARWGVQVRQLYIQPGFGAVLNDVRSSSTAERSGAVLRDSGIAIDIAGSGEMSLRSSAAGLAAWRDDCRPVHGDGWFATGDLAVREGDRYRLRGRVHEPLELPDGRTDNQWLVANRLKESRFILDAMVVSAPREPLRVLLELDADVAGDWARASGVPVKTFADLTQHPDLRGHLSRELDAINARVPGGVAVDVFAVIPEQLDPERGHVTCARRLVAARIREHYQELVLGLYAADPQQPMRS